MSYTELWSSLHSGYHSITTGYSGASYVCAEQPQPQQLQEERYFHQLSSSNPAVARSPAADMEMTEANLRYSQSQQWGGETDIYTSGDSSSSSGCSNSEGNVETMPGSGLTGAVAVRQASPDSNVQGTAHGSGEMQPHHQPSYEQNLFVKYAKQATDYDVYSFDTRWVDSRKFLRRPAAPHHFKVAEDNAADTLLSMKRGSVIHTAGPLSVDLHKLRDRDDQATALRDWDERGQQKHLDFSNTWSSRSQEVSRILSQPEEYDLPYTTRNMASEPKEFRPTAHYAAEECQPSTYVNFKMESPHFRTNGTGVTNGDLSSNVWSHSRSGVDNVTSEISTARWNLNAPPSPSHRHYLHQPLVIENCNDASTVRRNEPIQTQTRQQQQQQHPNNNNNSRTHAHQCHICGKSCTRPSSLKTHLRCHYGEKPYFCQLCGRSFSQAANLTAHMRIDSGEKPFKCAVCYRRFSQSSSVKTHMRTHTGERPYPCPFCSKSFSDSSTLSNHRRIHTGERPYQCRICCRPFSQSGNLNRHMRIHQRMSFQTVA